MRYLYLFHPSVILQFFVLGLLLFIPLYPKLPLFDISFTWTYVRLEDIFVAFSFLFFGFFLFRKQVTVRNGLFLPIVIFWLIGFFSSVGALLTLGHADNWAIFKPHLIVLHYLRRIEYLGVFFLAYSALLYLGWRGVTRFFIVLLLGFWGVVVYGIGQKFFGFPAYLTMNEEFAKGIGIPLQPGTRVSSTFGGHYDLAGYLVFVIPIIFSLFWYARRLRYKLVLLCSVVFGLYVMLLTSSRISFFALFIALGIVAVMNISHKKYIFFGFLCVLFFTFIFGQSTILERLEKTLRIRDVIIDRHTGKVMEIPTVSKDWGGLPESDRVILLPFFSGVATHSAYQVVKYEKGTQAPYRDDVPFETHVVEVPQADLKETMVYEKKEIIEEVRVVSGDFVKRSALIFDISFTTRIDGSWPVALRAFARNPFLGQGYSTVTAAVDSSFVRALGEVGLLGFISFFSIIVIFLVRAYRFLHVTHHQYARLVVMGVMAGTVGLLINGLFIDIFEASKVAFVFWLTLGVALWIIERSGFDHVATSSSSRFV